MPNAVRVSFSNSPSLGISNFETDTAEHWRDLSLQAPARTPGVGRGVASRRPLFRTAIYRRRGVALGTCGFLAFSSTDRGAAERSGFARYVGSKSLSEQITPTLRRFHPCPIRGSIRIGGGRGARPET